MQHLPYYIEKNQDYQAREKSLQTPMIKSQNLQDLRRETIVQTSQKEEDGATRLYFAKTSLSFELSFHFIIRVLLDLIAMEIIV